MNIEGNPSTKQKNISSSYASENSSTKSYSPPNSIHLSNDSSVQEDVLLPNQKDEYTELTNSISFVKGKQIKQYSQKQEQEIEEVHKEEPNMKSEGFSHKKVSLEAKVNRKNQYYLAMFECCLCSEIFEEDDLLQFTKCIHRFCHKCAMGYIKIQITNQSKITCPVEACSSRFVINMTIKDYLTSSELEELKAIEGSDKNRVGKIMEEKDEIEISEDEDIVDDEGEEEDHRENLETDENLMGETITTKHKLNEAEEMKVLSPKKASSVPYQITRTPSKILNHSQIQSRNQSPITNDSVFNNFMKKEHSFPTPRELTLPETIFKKICAKLWLRKWSRFFALFPISVIVLCLFFACVACWLAWVITYFIIVWVLTIPLIWSTFEIYGCFHRSIKNTILKNVTFIVCLIGFPLMIIFFQMITFGIIIYYSLYSPDMGLVLRGKQPLFISCKKIILNPSYKFGHLCHCKIDKICEHCSQKRLVLCLMI